MENKLLNREDIVKDILKSTSTSRKVVNNE